MKRLPLFLIFCSLCLAFAPAQAYQVLSSKELGRDEAKNQNVVVKCTTDAGKVSTQTCSLRRYAKCSGAGQAKNCSSWKQWEDLRAPGRGYSDWKSAASACCQSKGLR